MLQRGKFLAIPTEIISFQLDISQEEVENIIEDDRKEKEKLSLKETSSPDASMGLFYLDAVVNIEYVGGFEVRTRV